MKIYKPKTSVSALAFINLHLFKMIEVLRRLSKIINVRSALAEALAKSVGDVGYFT
jgi:hypothetical protein